jgi:ketosteroid isomerase-like protein
VSATRVGDTPLPYMLDHRAECLAAHGQAIFDTGRHFGEHEPLDQSFPFELVQLPRQDALARRGNRSTQLTVPLPLCAGLSQSYDDSSLVPAANEPDERIDRIAERIGMIRGSVHVTHIAPELRKRNRDELVKYFLLLLSIVTIPAPTASAQLTRNVRAELEKAYRENADAYMRGDISAVMALRAPDFHAVGPDGTIRDRQAMELYMSGIMNGVRQWNSMQLTIDSIDVRGDTAFVTMRQHLDRMALRPDNLVHHVESWATQREIWVWSGSRWLMWRVDQVRNQKRLVDGRPE